MRPLIKTTPVRVTAIVMSVVVGAVICYAISVTFSFLADASC